MREAAIGILFDSAKVLFVKRCDTPIWVLPGGGIDEGETPEQAVVREVFEETGLVVTIQRKCGEYYPINSLAAKTYVFECIPLKGSLTVGDETKELAYYPLTKLPSPLFPLHKDWLQDFLNNKDVVRKPIKVNIFKILVYFLKHPLLVSRYLLAKYSPYANKRDE